MKPCKARDIETALVKKGFVKKTAHHTLFYLRINGKITGIHTFMSHGIREYDDPLLAKMKSQLHLSAKELESFIRCPLTFKEYVTILIERGILENFRNLR